jgi:ABC-type branched-subunit amino acid transport system substrate-binding protein
MFVFDDPEWGHSYQKMWSELASKYGIEITDTFVTSEPTPDFRSMVTRALAKKPDLLMLAHEPITFSKAVAATRFSGPILSANNYLEVLHQQEDVGRIAQQVIIADPVISQEFRRSYEERFREPPILEAYSGYEAIRATVKALQGNREHPERVVKGLKYQGAGGEVDFTGASCAGNKTGWGLFRIEGRSTVPWD